MRIFNRPLNGLTILSCCTSLDDRTSPTSIDRPITIENHQPRPIPAPLPEPQEKSHLRDKEWITRTKSFVSCVSNHKSISGLRDLGSDKFSHGSPSPTTPAFRDIEDELTSPILPAFRDNEEELPSPTSSIFPHTGHESFGYQDPIFQPLYLRFSKSENDWASVVTQVCGQVSPEVSGDEKQSLHPSNNFGSEKKERLSLREPVDVKTLSEFMPKSDDIFNLAPKPKFLSHSRVQSEPAASERIKAALDERSKLAKRLKDLEDDIERKSIFLSSRPSSRTSTKANTREKMDLPHPLKSAPTHPFRRPTGRSLSLTSHNIRPDWGTPPPPLPLVFKTSNTKKEKTLSRVSSWLIASSQNDNKPSISITNTPRPVTDRDGFYQCLGPSQLTTGTATSVSDCFSDQPTIWTNSESSPALKSDVSGFEAVEYCDLPYKIPEDFLKITDSRKSGVKNSLGYMESGAGIAY